MASMEACVALLAEVPPELLTATFMAALRKEESERARRRREGEDSAALAAAAAAAAAAATTACAAFAAASMATSDTAGGGGYRSPDTPAVSFTGEKPYCTTCRESTLPGKRRLSCCCEVGESARLGGGCRAVRARGTAAAAAAAPPGMQGFSAGDTVTDVPALPPPKRATAMVRAEPQKLAGCA
jgi:hypothetical protein